MTRPLGTIDSNSQERIPPHYNDNALATRKRPVTVPTERYSTSTHLVPSMPVINAPDCLFDPSCLTPPLQTLAQTLESNSNGCITTVDIAQAYQALYNRLRASATVLQASGGDTLKGRTPILIQCLKRDINEGLKFFSPIQPASLTRLPSSDTSVLGALEDPEIQMSIDASLLCQSSLRVVSALMMIPGLFTLLSDIEKSSLLHPIIEICVEHQLPIFDHRKIQHLAFSCMRTESACQSLSRSQVTAMVDAVSAALDVHDSENTQMYALKTAHAFLQSDAPRFIEPCSSILPKILNLFPTSSNTDRVEIVNLLCGFATAKCQVLAILPDVVTSISADTHQFLEKHKSRNKSVGEEHLLPCILREAIKGDGGIWALTSIAALVILGDAHIFSHPRSLKIVFDALRHSSRHKTPAIASLHTEVWACLVWALSRSFSIQDESHIEARKDMYQRAFQLLAQEMRPSVGTRLVAVLVRDHSPTDGRPLRAWNVQQAVAITKQLMKDPCLQTFHEGYALLHRLLSGVSSTPSASSEPSLSDFVRDTLVNGSCLRMSLPDLEEALKIPHPFPLSYVHAFTEAEVQAHWQDLSESWVMAAERLQPTLSTEALNQLTGIWQSLLLSQAHLTQGQTHLAASSPFATNFATLIIGFVSPAAEPDERFEQLGLVRKWWNVLKNVFDPPWLSVPAGIILAGLLEKKVDLGIEKVQDMWSKLCFELISTGIPTFLHLLHSRAVNGPENSTETRLLWVLYLRHCVRVGCDQSWTDLAALLSLPFHCDYWTLSRKELDIWSQGLTVMLAAADQDGIDELRATQHMTEHLDGHRRDSIIVALFEVAAAGPPKLSICRQMIQLLNDRLSEWYSARNTSPALRAMSALGRFWEIEEVSKLTSSMALAQNGVSLWISDSQSYASDAEHDGMIKAVFIPALERLAVCQPARPGILTVLENLFVSVFAKPSALGADAFLAFFRTHYLGLPNLSTLCPERLITVAKSYADLCGEPLEGDISAISPSSPSTIISDSQSPDSPRKHFLRHEHSHFEEFQDVVGYSFQFSERDAPNQPGSSRATMTPVATNCGRTSKPPSSIQGPPRAGDIIQPLPGIFSGSPEIPIAPSRRVPKRHHTEGYFGSSTESESSESPRPLKRTKTMPGPLLSPTTPVLLSSPYRSRGAQGPLTSSPLPPSSDPELEPADEDENDYDSWEAGISHKDIQALRDELDLGGEEGQDDGTSSDVLVASSSPSTSNKFPLRSRMRERSQTAPEPSPQSPFLREKESFARGALRRHRTSGSFEHEGNTQLKAVRDAYAAVVDSGGVSQMGMEELMQMKRLASRIGQTVDEHIEQQWEKGRLEGGRSEGSASCRERSRTP